MFKRGLVSISFRQSAPEVISSAAEAAGLDVIEWGSDIHLPPCNRAQTDKIKALSASAGLSTPTYGSYFRLGLSPLPELESLIDTAIDLGARVVRIWGGTELVCPSDPGWDSLIRAAKDAAAMAKERGITLAIERHIKTVSELSENAVRFLTEVDSDAMRSYWQPNQRHTHAENLRSAKELAPFTECIHAFNWQGKDKLPLAAAEAEWVEYLAEFLPYARERDLPVLLEFMPDGRIESLATESVALDKIIKKCGI